ncbi:MAG: phage tail tape measure protein [Lachnospiraceae bacterium]|nr:phage tail tape measure protein [Lachnospiraceae bacterium]
MAEKKIGAKIVIDGEAEFRANLTSAKTALNNFQSELKLVTASFKDNANSLEALRAKQQVYIKLQEEQKNKVFLLQEMQDKVVKKYEEEQNTLTKLKQKREQLNNALEDAKNTYGENSEEVASLTKELEDANKQYESQERVVQKTGDRVNTYQRQLNDAKTELANLNDEVAQNERYLSEAAASADGCATSIDEYGNETQEAAEKTSVFGDVLKAELLSGIIKEGIKTLANGIKTIATAAVDTGKSFEASMSQVAATMGITTDEIAKGSTAYETLNKAAQDCGKATMFSASQSAEALNYLALAGYDAEKAAATLPKVLNLAAAGGLDLAYASDLVTDSMAALGLETQQLDTYIDEMTKTSQKSNTSVAQLGEATLVCAGTVSLTGQSLETMNTALGVLANNGIKGAEGGTHLRNMLLSLSAPTDTAKEGIEELGLQVYDSQGKMRDLNDIMIEMDRLMSDMKPEEKTKIIAKIFNKTDIAAVNAVLKSMNGEYKTLNGQIKDCSGAAQAMADTLNDNLKGRITILQSALEGLGITAYNLFDDEMKDAVDSATDAVSRLQGEIDNGDLGVSLRNMSEALGEFAINAVSTAEKALPKLIDGMTWLLENGDIVAGLIGGVTSAKIAYTVATEAATVAQKLFNVTANANPYIFLATAITGVIGAVTLYAKTADNAVDQLTESTQKLTDSSKKLNAEAAETSKKRGEIRAGYENEKAVCMKLAEELDALQSKTVLTAAEQARQAAVIDELNAAIPELNLSIDEQTGFLNMSTDALLENIDAQMALMKAEAAREDLAAIAEEQYEAEKNLAELETQQLELIEKRSELYAELREAAEGAAEVRYSEETQEALAQYNEDIKALTTEINNTKGTIDELGAEYEETTAYIADNEALSKASDAMENLGSAADEAGTEIVAMSQEAIEAYNEMYNDMCETIQSQMDLFSEFSTKSELSTAEILKNMESQVTGIAQWSENIQSLADRGINQGLLQYLADMGPQGAGYVQAFTQMTEEELEKANELFKDAMLLPYETTNQIMDAYTRAGEDAGTGYAQGMESKKDEILDIAEELPRDSLQLMRMVLDSHSPSMETYAIGEDFSDGLKLGISDNKDKILTIIKQVTSAMLTETRMGIPEEEYKNIGIRITDGLRSGIESGKSGVIESIRALCIESIQAAKEKLDIHSPSKAFAYLGEMSGQGYISGWEQTMQNIDSIIMDTMPDLPSGASNKIIGAQAVNNLRLPDALVSKMEQQNAGILDICSKMFDMMSHYMPEMANMQIVTDTGALIGELAPGLDAELGAIETEKRRGVG